MKRLYNLIQNKSTNLDRDACTKGDGEKRNGVGRGRDEAIRPSEREIERLRNPPESESGIGDRKWSLKSVIRKHQRSINSGRE